MLSLIVARARDGAIGRGGTIPWHAPEDLAFFQRETLGGAVIMGRRTWESLPRRPLPRRMNIVVTRAQLDGPDACAASLDNALALAETAGYLRVYGIGGARVYADLLPLADRLVLTRVDIDVADADTFFPPVPESQWRLVRRLELRPEPLRCTVEEYLRSHRPAAAEHTLALPGPGA
ncbi:MAG: dihydrofolate reductase [Rhodobacteraceae bacterium]|nr:dihydrofolate reductase [Paracoccaceae bacterium]